MGPHFCEYWVLGEEGAMCATGRTAGPRGVLTWLTGSTCRGRLGRRTSGESWWPWRRRWAGRGGVSGSPGNSTQANREGPGTLVLLPWPPDCEVCRPCQPGTSCPVSLAGVIIIYVQAGQGLNPMDRLKSHTELTRPLV